MSSTRPRRPLGAGQQIPDPEPKDPRARTVAERAADEEWTVSPERSRPATRGRRPLGTGPVGDGR
ncbi:hypothetical protein ACIO3O_37720 [Streptomyces sp. NPDC087440]|uniref:hypothetical protein n=1 Tax=Streptomyces sp. NPDC087440 TaxID=3365790 RepID=UPI00382FC4CA